jgi:hypothetical protein
VFYQLVLVGELVTTGGWWGSAVPYNWNTGHAPCSVFYTTTAPTGAGMPTTVVAMDFCDTDKHVGQLIASTESLIPDDATLTDVGPTTIAVWSTKDGIWSVAVTDRTMHGFLSVNGADPSVSVDVLAEVLAASPVVHLGSLPPLQP